MGKNKLSIASVLAALVVSASATAQSAFVVELKNPTTGQRITVTASKVFIDPDGAWRIDCTAPTTTCMTPTGPLGQNANTAVAPIQLTAPITDPNLEVAAHLRN